MSAVSKKEATRGRVFGQYHLSAGWFYALVIILVWVIALSGFALHESLGGNIGEGYETVAVTFSGITIAVVGFLLIALSIFKYKEK